jgi:hypothetical protein
MCSTVNAESEASKQSLLCVASNAGRGSGASAAAAPAAPAPEEEVEGPQTSALTSSCVICFDAAFDRDGFSDKTVLICDQCEREYHVSGGPCSPAGVR